MRGRLTTRFSLPHPRAPPCRGTARAACPRASLGDAPPRAEAGVGRPHRRSIFSAFDFLLRGTRSLALIGGGSFLGSAFYGVAAGGGGGGATGGGGWWRGGGGGGGGWWGGGGGGWQWPFGFDPFCPEPAEAIVLRFFVEDIKFINLPPTGPGCPSEDAIVAELETEVGDYTTQNKITQDEKQIIGMTPLFENCVCDIQKKGVGPDGRSARVVLVFKIKLVDWPPLERVTFKGTSWFFPRVRASHLTGFPRVRGRPALGPPRPALTRPAPPRPLDRARSPSASWTASAGRRSTARPSAS